MLAGALLYLVSSFQERVFVEGDLFGSSVAWIGDLDGDGHDDVATVVCAWKSDSGRNDLPGVAAFSARDGRMLWSGAQGLHVQRFCRRSLRRIGDLDQDGCEELALIAFRGDFLELAIVSGRDGSILRSCPVSAGVAEIACPGDLDGDSAADVVVVTGNLADAYAVSCRTGTVIWRFGSDPNWLLDPVPEHAEAVGDWDADGRNDVAFLANARAGAARNPFEPAPTAVLIVSGRDGKLLRAIDAPASLFHIRFCGAGDVDRDGHQDLAMAGHEWTGQWPDSWETRIFSGSDGRTLRSIPGILKDIKCGNITNAGDIDRDGWDDILVSQFMMLTAGTVDLRSGKDGSVLRTSEEPARADDVSEYFGYSLDAGGDADGDGVSDWVVGSCSPWGDPSSRLVVVSGANGLALQVIDRGNLAAPARPR